MKKINWHETAFVVVMVASIAFVLWAAYDFYQLSCKRVQHCGKVNGKIVISDRRGRPCYYIQVGMSNHKVGSVAYNTAVVGSSEVCLTLDGYNEVKSV